MFKILLLKLYHVLTVSSSQIVRPILEILKILLRLRRTPSSSIKKQNQSSARSQSRWLLYNYFKEPLQTNFQFRVHLNKTRSLSSACALFSPLTPRSNLQDLDNNGSFIQKFNLRAQLMVGLMLSGIQKITGNNGRKYFSLYFCPWVSGTYLNL